MKVLMFGTVYCDTVEKQHLAGQWGKLHGELNQDCDLLLVDSKSPLLVSGVPVLQLGDNIGHLARHGRDGWGRAFCAGLQYAADHDYDYAVHVEGDSLLRLSVMKFCQSMEEHALPALVCGVNGTKFKEFAWVETGVMFLSVPYTVESQFVERYNWLDGDAKRYPHTPEAVVYELMGQDGALNIAPIRTMRDDKKVLTTDNVREYDWISHAAPEVYDAFIASVMVAA